jgi:NADH-quinone oxidoreductase subunit N
VIPNLTAVYQSSVKRMLAYSSVGHVGFLLLAFISQGPASTGTIFYYLIAYSFSSLAAFTVLVFIEKEKGNHHIDSFSGLSKTHPMLAVGMTIALMSLAGIPPLSGFFAKYMVLMSAIENGQVTLAILAVVASLVGVFYYFRVIIAMFFGEPSGTASVTPVKTVVLLLLLLIVIIGVGLFPDFILN